jgi:hypothetical protein
VLEEIMSKAFLTAAETSQYLEDKGISTMTEKVLRTERRTGKGIPFCRVGKFALYRKADIDTWLDKLPRFSSTSAEVVSGK